MPNPLEQISGQGNQPSQVPLQQAQQIPQPGGPQPQGPESVPAQVLDPQQQAMQAAAVQADELFLQQTGRSFIQAMQAGQATPEDEQVFAQLVQQVLSGSLDGNQQFGLTSPQSVV